MPMVQTAESRRLQMRLAGALYVVIIAAGIWSEAFVRAPLIVPGDTAATAANLAAAEGLVRLSFAADTIMALCDAGVAVLLFVLLWPVSAALALAAMVFRLIQTSTLVANLLNQQAALLVIGANEGAAGSAHPGPSALHLMQVQSLGYDLGLVFFGVCNIVLALIILRSGWAPRIIGWLLAGAGTVYLTGSYLRFLSPALSDGFAYAYALPLLAETAFALWLLVIAREGPRRLAQSEPAPH
ncbi:MAG: DUF4386 domain-containing protein [Paracoccaceae bacterium]